MKGEGVVDLSLGVVDAEIGMLEKIWVEFNAWCSGEYEQMLQSTRGRGREGRKEGGLIGEEVVEVGRCRRVK